MYYPQSIFNFKKIAFIVILMSMLISRSLLASEDIQGMRIWPSQDNTRVVFDLSGPVEYKIFPLENPNRVVVDITNAKFKGYIDEISLMGTQISKVRHSMAEKGKLRIVFDVSEKLNPTAFLLSPNESYGNRLVIDLAQKHMPRSASKADKKERFSQRGWGRSKDANAQEPEPSARSTVIDSKEFSTREFIVALDPGHGGDDTGAIGKHQHLKEKDVVLAVSKRLQAMINAQPGMRAILIRNGDFYIGLRKRMEVAREQGADLFISVHADSFKDPRATGASVFVLSEKGASNEAARWLAERENSSDLAGGLKLEDKSPVLASVLLDLSQTASQSASHELATHLISNLNKVTDLHHKGVQSAGFMVLKSPDIPSVLVELGFISNRKGEEKLLNTIHQQALATALLTGIKTYASKRPAPIESDSWTVAQKRSKNQG